MKNIIKENVNSRDCDRSLSLHYPNGDLPKHFPVN